ncbi:Potassium voltage-gated channel protein eag (Ether-a-go-go protein) [Durusdinium trenchii]|uniref:Potassium voltage-gated channel protein eag (Ether-a-go-go protein) n=1 Tax=Durusdinium trenchii TaxID=1381693 RepID=A0ABP0H725_9DINO
MDGSMQLRRKPGVLRKLRSKLQSKWDSPGLLLLLLGAWLICITMYPLIVLFPTTLQSKTRLTAISNVSLVLDVILAVFFLCVCFLGPPRASRLNRGLRASGGVGRAEAFWMPLIDFCVATPVATLALLSNNAAAGNQGLPSSSLVAGCLLRSFAGARVARHSEMLFSVIDLLTLQRQGNLREMITLLCGIFFLSFLFAGLFFLDGYQLWSASHLAGDGTAAREALSNSTKLLYEADSLVDDFITAIYFIVQTLFTVGYGDIVPSHVRGFTLACLFVVFGTVVHALVIAHMTSLLQNLNVTTASFREKMETIQAYLCARSVKQSNRTKVIEYFEFLWERQHGELEESVLQTLPFFLRDKLNQGRRSSVLKIKAFQGRDLAFVDAVVASMQSQVLVPNEWLCIRTRPVDHLFLLLEGKLHIMSPGKGDGVDAAKQDALRRNSFPGEGGASNKQRVFGASHKMSQVLEVLSPEHSGFVGEEILFSRRARHKFSVRAANMCEVQALSTESYHFVLQLFHGEQAESGKLQKRVFALTKIDDEVSDEDDDELSHFHAGSETQPQSPDMVQQQEKQEMLSTRKSLVSQFLGRRFPFKESSSGAYQVTPVLSVDTKGPKRARRQSLEFLQDAIVAGAGIQETSVLEDLSEDNRGDCSSGARLSSAGVSLGIPSFQMALGMLRKLRVQSGMVSAGSTRSIRVAPAKVLRRGAVGGERGDEDYGTSTDPFVPKIPDFIEILDLDSVSRAKEATKDIGLLAMIQLWNNRITSRSEKGGRVGYRGSSMFSAMSVDHKIAWIVDKVQTLARSVKRVTARQRFQASLEWFVFGCICYHCVAPTLQLAFYQRAVQATPMADVSRTETLWIQDLIADLVLLSGSMLLQPFKCSTVSAARLPVSKETRKEPAPGSVDLLRRTRMSIWNSLGAVQDLGGNATRWFRTENQTQPFLTMALLICGLLSAIVRGSEAFVKLGVVLRLPFLVLLWRLLTVELDRVGNRSQSFRSLSTLQRVGLQVAVAMAVMSHWFSCLWIVLNTEDPSYAFSSEYLWAFYWALITVSTVGFGAPATSSIGRLFSVIVIVVGATMYAGMISVLAAVTRSSGTGDNHVEHFADCLSQYLASHEFPRPLLKACNSFIEYAAANHLRITEEQFLKTAFPSSLEQLLRLEILGERLVSRSPIFEGLPRHLALSILSKLKRHLFIPQSIITCGMSKETGRKKKEPCHDRGITEAMIFLEAGEAEILSQESKQIGKRVAGEAFGAIALVDPQKQNLALRAMTFCEVWVLFKADLDRAISDYETFVAAESESGVRRGATGRLVEKEHHESQGSADRAGQEETVSVDLVSLIHERALEVAQNTGNIAKNLNNAKLNKLMMADEEEEGITTGRRPDRFVLDPKGGFQRTWHTLMFGAILFNVATVPYRAGLGSGTVSMQNSLFLACDGVADAMFFLDAVLRWNVFAVESNGVVQWKRESFSKNYRSKDIIKDIISTLPLGWVALLVYGTSGLLVNEYAVLRILTFVRIYRMKFCAATVVQRMKARLNANYVSLALLLTGILLFAHVGACFFFGLARVNQLRGRQDTWATASSDYPLLLLEFDASTNTSVHALTSQSYPRSLYFGVAALTTVGYGDYAPVADNEVVYSIVLLLCGGVLYALILNQLEQIIAQSDISSIMFQRRMNDLQIYLRFRSVNSSLAQRAVAYLNASWVQQKGVEESWIHDQLPLGIKRWIRYELLGSRMLERFPLFHEWDREEDLLDLMSPETIMENETIHLRDQLIFKCYFVVEGTLEYVSQDGKTVLKSFGSGDVVGHLSLFCNEPTECLCRTSSRVRALVLHRRDLDDFLLRHPTLASSFRAQLPELEAELRRRYSLATFTKNLGKAKVNKIFAQEETNRDMGTLRDGMRLLGVSNPFRRRWNLLVLLAVWYNLCTIPYRSCFLRNSVVRHENLDSVYDQAVFNLCDAIFDSVLWVNVIMEMTVFSVKLKSGILLRTRAEVWRHVVRRRLVFYTAALFPFDLMLRTNLWGLEDPALWEPGVGAKAAMVGVFRVNRLIMLFTVPGLYNSMVAFMEEKGIVLSAGKRQILILLISGMVVTHLFACVKGAMSTRYQFMLPEGFAPLEAYAVCLYWALYTVSTVGYGNVPVDAPLFAVGCMLFGAFLIDAGVTATLSNILSNRDSRMSRSRKLRDCLAQYMKTHHIEPEVRRELLDFVDYRMFSLENVNESALLLETNLPSYLRVEIAAFCALRSVPRLQQHPSFAGLSLGMLQTMALMLEPVVLSEGQYVFLPRVDREDVDPGVDSAAALVNKESAAVKRATRFQNLVHVNSSLSSSAFQNSTRSMTSSPLILPQGPFQAASISTSNDTRPAEEDHERSVQEKIKVGKAAARNFEASASVRVNAEEADTFRSWEAPASSFAFAAVANLDKRRTGSTAAAVLDEGFLFLMSGEVEIHTKGGNAKTIRSGLLSRSSGIDSAKCLTHAELFALDVHQFGVLLEHGCGIGGVFDSFEDLVRDADGLKALKQHMSEDTNSGMFAPDLSFVQDCLNFETKPSEELASRIWDRHFDRRSTEGFSPEIKQAVSHAIETMPLPVECFHPAFSVAIARLERNIKARFMTSLEYFELIQEHKERPPGAAAKSEACLAPGKTKGETGAAQDLTSQLTTEKLGEALPSRDRAVSILEPLQSHKRASRIVDHLEGIEDLHNQ